MRRLPPLAWRSACGTYEIVVVRRCFLSMREMALAHAPVEVGTSLLGQYTDRNNVATVLGLAPLTPDSRGTRWSFLRGVKGLKEYFAGVYKKFRGRRYYVGEWHSHPGATTSASDVDDYNQADLSKTERSQCPEAILLIVGGDLEQKPTLGVYVYSRTRGRVDLMPA